MGTLFGLFTFIFGAGSQLPVYANTDNFVIVDVRTPAEFEESHVTGAINVDFLNSEFRKKVAQLDKEKSYKVYCRSGNRSGQAMQLMKSIGFKDVENLGSLMQASQRLSRKCEGRNSC